MTYTVSVQTIFTATHSLILSGEPEPPHNHEWRVEAVVAANELDADGVVIDFHLLRGLLTNALTDLTSAESINNLPWFSDRNPSTEHIAHHIHQRLAPTLPARVLLVEVKLWETPTCHAIYRPQVDI